MANDDEQITGAYEAGLEEEDMNPAGDGDGGDGQEDVSARRRPERG